MAARALFQRGLHKCDVDAGSTISLSHSQQYTSPEVALALEAGNDTITVDPATDMWAVGVIAFELITGEQAFPEEGMDPTSARHGMLSALAGRAQLPWERPDAEPHLAKLRGLRRTVMRCLSRDPQRRPSSQALLVSWELSFDHMMTRQAGTCMQSTSVDLSG